MALLKNLQNTEYETARRADQP